MLTEDTDEDVRDVAAGALSTLWQGTKDPHILRALAKAALNDRDEDVRNAAYKAMIIVDGVPREQYLEILTTESLRVDPVRVRAILAKSE